MANNPRPKYSIQVIAAIIGFVAIFVTVVAFAFVFSPPTLKPTPTTIQPTSSLSSRYQPEIIPIPTDTPDLAGTVTMEPTNTPAPTLIPKVTSTYTLVNGPLPDLTVTGISGPICVPDHIGTVFEFTIYVRNIGRARTRSFGSFDIGVFLIVGQRRYGLDEWASKFNGVIGTSNMEISNLNPNQDIKLSLVIDLNGNKNFGIEVIANSGANTIPEADTTNNTLIKYYSLYCY